MSSTQQSEIEARASELALRMVGQRFEQALAIRRQFVSHGVPDVIVQYLVEKKNHPWWNHIDELVPTLVAVETAKPVLFKAEDTNLVEAIRSTESFARKYFGAEINQLAKTFAWPVELPWKNVMVIFDPGFDNRQAVERAIKDQGLAKWEEEDVMKYSGAAALPRPTFRIIENSIRPNEDTLGDKAKSPNQLNAGSRFYLDLRGYILAFGLVHFVSKDYLDSGTWTWFPRSRLPWGRVAAGRWDPDDSRILFRWSGSGNIDPYFGARLAIPVPPKT
ncbi:MAG: hypothetical protein NT077_04100 [Candidatus Taylorbacteria bacterium]|nr:hypothetical protein [Candidatus Taylorbacteria bacterium]